jgi:hypothetical protein
MSPCANPWNLDACYLAKRNVTADVVSQSADFNMKIILGYGGPHNHLKYGREMRRILLKRRYRGSSLTLLALKMKEEGHS